MTAVLPFRAPVPSDALAIRAAVAATRRLYPEADVENIVEVAIKNAVPLGLVKGILFDQIAATHALRPGEVEFTRAPFAAITGATRRRA